MDYIIQDIHQYLKVTVMLIRFLIILKLNQLVDMYLPWEVLLFLGSFLNKRV